MIPCYSEFRAYALIRQYWWVRKHETRSNRESCVGFISLTFLWFSSTLNDKINWDQCCNWTGRELVGTKVNHRLSTDLLQKVVLFGTGRILRKWQQYSWTWISHETKFATLFFLGEGFFVSKWEPGSSFLFFAGCSSVFPFTFSFFLFSFPFTDSSSMLLFSPSFSDSSVGWSQNWKKKLLISIIKFINFLIFATQWLQNSSPKLI